MNAVYLSLRYGVVHRGSMLSAPPRRSSPRSHWVVGSVHLLIHADGPRLSRGSVVNPMRPFGGVPPSLGLAACSTFIAGRQLQRCVQGNTQRPALQSGWPLCYGSSVFVNGADDATPLQCACDTHRGYRKGVTYPRSESCGLGPAPRGGHQPRSVSRVHAPVSWHDHSPVQARRNALRGVVPRSAGRSLRWRAHSRSRQVLPDDGQEGTRLSPSSGYGLPWTPPRYSGWSSVGNGQPTTGASVP